MYEKEQDKHENNMPLFNNVEKLQVLNNNLLNVSRFLCVSFKKKPVYNSMMFIYYVGDMKVS